MGEVTWQPDPTLGAPGRRRIDDEVEKLPVRTKQLDLSLDAEEAEEANRKRRRRRARDEDEDDE